MSENGFGLFVPINVTKNEFISTSWMAYVPSNIAGFLTHSLYDGSAGSRVYALVMSKCLIGALVAIASSKMR